MPKPIPPVIKDALAVFDDDTLVKLMLLQAATTFPSFEEGGPRLKAAADRARELIRNAWTNAQAAAGKSISP